MENVKKLLSLNVNDKTEKKNGMTYLSWAWAWQKVLEVAPDSTYKVRKNEHGSPYFKDDDTGYMVFTEVTIDGITREMWLPVMDYNNNAMKSEPYKTDGKYPKDVAKASMFDVNKAIMRCLTKNLAMFGLGLYIYAGEDLPEESKEEKEQKALAKKKIPKLWVEPMEDMIARKGLTVPGVCQTYKFKSIADLTHEQYYYLKNDVLEKMEDKA